MSDKLRETLLQRTRHQFRNDPEEVPGSDLTKTWLLKRMREVTRDPEVAAGWEVMQCWNTLRHSNLPPTEEWLALPRTHIMFREIRKTIARAHQWLDRLSCRDGHIARPSAVGRMSRAGLLKHLLDLSERYNRSHIHDGQVVP